MSADGMHKSQDQTIVRDEQLDLLDEYVRRLQQGDRSQRTTILYQHPELSPLLDCLDALESLAPPDTGCAPIPEAPIPQTFGKYELLAEIGRGGMGVVFRARQSDLDRIVCLKMILAGRFASKEQIDRFYSEAHTAGRLQHPNIVRIHEVGALHGQHYFAMEYIAGRTLAEMIADGPLPAETAARLLADLAHAVEHLHRGAIVHRDLKPSNVLVDAGGNPHLTDFGLAKIFTGDSNLTGTGAIMGTPCYMAPEQAAGRGDEVGPRSDVYSLGAILYDMLTGQPPFRQENPLDTLMQVMDREPTSPSEINPKVPQELETVCLKCLEKRPEDRFSSASELALELERYLRGEPIKTRSRSTLVELLRWSRREPALAARILALSVFLIIEQLWYFWFGVVELAHWRAMSAILIAWVLAGWVFHRRISGENAPLSSILTAEATDVVLLTLTLLVAEGLSSPLVLGYPLLTVASGLWARARLVVGMTVLCILSYLVVLIDTIVRRPAFNRTFDFHVIVVLSLIVVGCITTYQVHRLRVLSRYYVSRPRDAN